MTEVSEITGCVEMVRKRAKETGLTPEWIMAAIYVRAMRGVSTGFLRRSLEQGEPAAKERPAPL